MNSFFNQVLSRMKLVSSCTFLTMAGLSIQSSNVFADINIHAASCQPATLKQAFNLNTSWSQAGILNTSQTTTIFVVCPLTVDDNTDGITDIKFEGGFVANSLGRSISCNLLEMDLRDVPATGVENNRNIGTITDLNLGQSSYPYGSDGPTTALAGLGYNFVASDDALVVVCSLPPNARLGFIQLTGD